MRGRQDILELYLQDKPLADDVDVKAIARGTPGFNGAGKRCTVLFHISNSDSVQNWSNITYFEVHSYL